MIFLFEEHPYDASFLEKVLGYIKGESKSKSKSGFNTQKTDNGITIKGVGYCFYNGQPVFVLPQVFLYKKDNEEYAFGQKIDFKGVDVFGAQVEKKGLKETFTDVNVPLTHKLQHRFLFSLSGWLYSAIDLYNRKRETNSSVQTPPRPEVRQYKKNERFATFPDIIKSMEQFYKKNQALFVFVAKNKNSGNHKINWQRTISKKTPFVQNGTPIYVDTVNKVKVFDLDDRLLVLYFSAMKFIQDEYGCAMPQSDFYQPLKHNEMKRLMENGRGLRELKKIRHKYFEDRLLQLFNIVEAFFYWGSRYKDKNGCSQDYLIANSFNKVFEAMIDELVGDPQFDKEKKNKDGKIIDHLYKDDSLIFASRGAEKIWHIGDSKYYKDPDDIKGKSIYKQFTYAKNVMQNFFNPGYVNNENDGINSENDFYADLSCDHHGIRYRDKLTEGYSVTPNFFIRGDVPEYKEESQYTDKYFCSNAEQRNNLIAEVDNEEIEETNIKDHLWKNRNRHFKNRLFDRDTLLLQVYNVNFLYTLKAYVLKRSSLRKEFRETAHKLFHNNFLMLLDKKYDFFAIWPNGKDVNGKKIVDAERVFVDKHFRTLVGKIFKPLGSKCLILALEKEIDSTDAKNISKMWEDIKDECTYFHISPAVFFPMKEDVLPEANFNRRSCYFDKEKFGVFVGRRAFENAGIGEARSLPRKLCGHMLTGNVLGDVDLERISRRKSPLDDYYFLPAKEEKKRSVKRNKKKAPLKHKGATTKRKKSAKVRKGAAKKR